MSTFKENSGILLHALLKRGLSEEQPKSDTIPVATAAPDAFKLDAMTTEPEDLDTLAPNSPVPSPSQPPSLTLGRELSSSSSGPGSTTRDPLEGELQSRLGQLVISANSKVSSSSEEECTNWPADRQTDKESDRQREKLKPKERERERQRVSDKSRERASEAVEQVNGQEIKRSEKLIKSPSVREDGRSRERRFEKACESLDMKVEDQEQKRGDKREPNRQSKRQHKRDAEKEAGPKVGARSGSSASSPAVTPSSHEGALSNNQVGRCTQDLIFICRASSACTCIAVCLLPVCKLLNSFFLCLQNLFPITTSCVIYLTISAVIICPSSHVFSGLLCCF